MRGAPRITCVLVLVLFALSTLSASGCGSKGSTSNTPASQSSATATAPKTHLAKTKFVLHAGLAFGAFHRYIYKPYKAGAFKGGLLHHKKALLKAALAAAFAYHETRLALDDARSSRILSKVLAPLLALQTKLSSLQTAFKRLRADPTTIQSANTDASTAGATSAQAGQPIQDQPTPQLGG